MKEKYYDFVGDPVVQKNEDDNPIVSYWVQCQKDMERDLGQHRKTMFNVTRVHTLLFNLDSKINYSIWNSQLQTFK